MSNNAAVTVDGGEIGRAQALHAFAARVEPHTDMNPVLLKPQADRSAQLIVHGRVRGILGASNFREARRSLLPEVMASYRRLAAQCEIVLVEGAGSPAEINLREGDIANMGFAREAGVPVVLVGDIDRGGVIAAVVGTRAVLAPEDAAMIRGFVINKFRGDPALFADGYQAIERLRRWRGYGLVPWLSAAARLPSEDAVVLERGHRASPRRKLIVCPILPRIANFDDLDPLKLEADVEVAIDSARRAHPCRGCADRAAGIEGDHRRPGRGPRAGLGHRHFCPPSARRRRSRDCAAAIRCSAGASATRSAIEGASGEAAGLGLLEVETELTPRKSCARAREARWARTSSAMRCTWG